MRRSRLDRAFFLLLLGLLWIGLSFVVELSETETALVAGAFLLLAAFVVSSDGASGKGPGPARRWRALSYRSKVNVFAAILAVAAGAAAGVLLLSEPNPEKCPEASGEIDACSVPTEKVEKTTETTGVVGDAGDGAAETTVGKDSQSGKPGKPSTTTEVEEKSKYATADESLLGRSVDNQAGVIVIRIGLALLAAFIVGLIFQRIALGKYGVKLPFGLGEFAEISDEQAEAVTKEAKKDKKLGSALETAKSAGDGIDLTSPAETRIKLVAARNDVEDGLRAKAVLVHGVDESAPINEVIDGLAAQEVIESSGRMALREMIELGDQAAQGATIDPGVRSWLVQEGQYLPEAIDRLQIS